MRWVECGVIDLAAFTMDSSGFPGQSQYTKVRNGLLEEVCAKKEKDNAFTRVKQADLSSHNRTVRFWS